jgi:hypothetical protein
MPIYRKIIWEPAANSLDGPAGRTHVTLVNFSADVRALLAIDTPIGQQTTYKTLRNRCKCQKRFSLLCTHSFHVHKMFKFTRKSFFWNITNFEIWNFKSWPPVQGLRVSQEKCSSLAPISAIPPSPPVSIRCVGSAPSCSTTHLFTTIRVVSFFVIRPVTSRNVCRNLLLTVHMN